MSRKKSQKQKTMQKGLIAQLRYLLSSDKKMNKRLKPDDSDPPPTGWPFVKKYPNRKGKVKYHDR